MHILNLRNKEFFGLFFFLFGDVLSVSNFLYTPKERIKSMTMAMKQNQGPDYIIIQSLHGSLQECMNALELLRKDFLFDSRTYSFSVLYPQLINLFENNANIDITVNVIWCIRAALESNEDNIKVIQNEQDIRLISNLFNRRISPAFCEHAIHVLLVLCQFKASVISQYLDKSILLAYISDLTVSPIERKIASSLFSKLAQFSTFPLTEDILRQLFLLINGNSGEISSNILTAIASIVEKSYDQIPLSLTHFLCDILMKNKFIKFIPIILKSLISLCNSRAHVVAIHQKNLDFESLFFSPPFNNAPNEHFFCLIMLIMHLLPHYTDPYLPLSSLQLPGHRTSLNYHNTAFCQSVKKLVERIIVEKQYVPNFVLHCYATILQCESEDARSNHKIKDSIISQEFNYDELFAYQESIDLAFKKYTDKINLTVQNQENTQMHPQLIRRMLMKIIEINKASPGVYPLPQYIQEAQYIDSLSPANLAKAEEFIKSHLQEILEENKNKTHQINELNRIIPKDIELPTNPFLRTTDFAESNAKSQTLNLLNELGVSRKLLLFFIHPNDEEVYIVEKEIDPKLLNTLISFSTSPRFSTCVYPVLLFYANSRRLAESGITKLLSCWTVSNSHMQFFNKYCIPFIKKLSSMASKPNLPPSLTTYSDIIQISRLALNKQISPNYFLYSDYVPNVIQYLSLMNHTNKPSESDIIGLVKLTYSCLPIFPLPFSSQKASIRHFLRLVTTPLAVNIRTENYVPYTVTTTMLQPLWELKYMLEDAYQEHDENYLTFLMKNHPEYSKYIHPSLRPTKAHKGLLIDIFLNAISSGNKNAKNYYKSRWRFNDSVLSYFFRPIGPSPSLKPLHNPTISLSQPEHQFNKIEFNDIPFQYGCDLFRLITLFRVHYQMSVVLPPFTDRIYKQLSNPFFSICRLSYPITLIHNYPYLFPFNQRLLAFKLTYFSPFFAIKTLINEFNLMDYADLREFRPPPLSLQVDRDKLYEDGCNILEFFCAHSLEIEVSFLNDIAIGPGPTRTFFLELAKEFTRVDRGLFRNDYSFKRESNEFCFSHNGLFPLPSNKTAEMTLFGILIAKSILMEISLNIAINPAFFRLVAGNRITMADVDPDFDKALQTPEGFYGLDFTYPGNPSLEMIKDGAHTIVDEYNVNKYISSVISFTTGKQLQPLISGFINGFNMVFPITSLMMSGILSPEEISSIIKGQNDLITKDDLIKYCTFSGYQPNSPIAEMFFDYVTLLDADGQANLLLFITGSPILPVGGLKSLSPKLTIEKLYPKNVLQNPDIELPTSYTCTYTINLPEYSSKEIFVRQMDLALKFGSKSFGRL